MGKTNTWNYTFIMFGGWKAVRACRHVVRRVQQSNVPTMRDWGHSCHNPQLKLSSPHGWVNVGVQLVPHWLPTPSIPYSTRIQGICCSQCKYSKAFALTTWTSLGKADELNNVLRFSRRNKKSNETEGFHIMTIVEYFGGHTTQVHICDGLHYLTRAEENTAFLKNVALFNKCAFLKHLSFDVNNLRVDRHSLSNLPFLSI
jgi:hypothetical protein